MLSSFLSGYGPFAPCARNCAGSGDLRQFLKDYRPYGGKVVSEKFQVFLTPAAAGITGKVCYYGELWLKKGYRGHCLTALLPRLAFALSLLQWRPDFIIGVMEPLAACKGLAVREGYTHVEQGSIFWRQRAADARLEEWFVWMSREDIKHIMRTPPERLKQLYDEASRQKPIPSGETA